MNDSDLRNQFTAYMQKVVYHAKVDYIRRKKHNSPRSRSVARKRQSLPMSKIFVWHPILNSILKNDVWLTALRHCH